MTSDWVFVVCYSNVLHSGIVVCIHTDDLNHPRTYVHLQHTLLCHHVHIDAPRKSRTRPHPSHLVGNVCDASATCQQCRVKSPIFCWQGKCADTVTWALYYENTQKYKEKITNKLLKDLFINIVMSMTCISNIYLSNIPIEVFDITSQGNMHQFRDMSARRVATRQYDMSFGPFSWHVSCRHFQLRSPVRFRKSDPIRGKRTANKWTQWRALEWCW